MKPQLSAALAIAFSAVVGYLSYDFGFTNPLEAVLLALMTGIFSELTLVLWRLEDLNLRNRQDAGRLLSKIHQLEDIESESALFVDMQKDFADVRAQSHGAKDLFVTHVSTELAGLSQRLSDANRKKEVRIKSDYIINVDGVFEALNVSTNKEVRLTYPISAGESWVGGPSDLRFLEVLLGKVSRGVVEKLRMFFLLDHDVDAESEEMQKVFQWLNRQTRVQVKYAKAAEFAKVCDLNGIDPNHLDFGIYADRMLFRTTSAGPDHEGIYSKDEDQIDRYKSVYDQTWESENISRGVATAPEAIKRLGLADVCLIESPKNTLAIESK